MRIALVGLGGMGTVHYMNYQHIPGAVVAAAVGATEADRTRAAEWGIPLYPTLTALCAEQAVDLVDICVPTWLHRSLAEESLSLGNHTLVEKPAALTLQDARAMYAAADRAGKQLYVGQVLQFTPEVAALRSVVRDGRYGKALDAHFERLSAAPRWTQGSWLFDAHKSGLIPFDLHIHDLDVIVSLFGKPETISCTTAGAADKPYREQYRFLYGYPGLTVCAEAAWFNAAIPFTARWRVYFERGMLVNDADGLRGYGADGEVTVFDTEEPEKIPTGINVPPTGMFLTELKHYVACAAENRPSDRVPREQVLAVLDVLEQVTGKG